MMKKKFAVMIHLEEEDMARLKEVAESQFTNPTALSRRLIITGLNRLIRELEEQEQE